MILVCGGPLAAQPEEAGSTGGGPGAGADPEAPLTADQRRELSMLLRVVDDERQERSQRRDAAATLLGRRWPAAIRSIAERLRTTESVALRRAIASAVALRDDPPNELIDPLLALIGTSETALRDDVAAALGRYENAGVSERLIAIARDGEKSQTERIGAIHALAEHRQSEVIEALMALIGEDHAEPIRDAAFVALGKLTGIREHGKRAEAWRSWWRKHRNLPQDRWLARLVRTLSERNRRLDGEQDKLQARLAEVYSQAYRATADAERPALLEQMLGDSVVDVRLRGLALIERKLLNAQSIAAPVRARLRQLMDDPSERVRNQAVALLRDLDDEPAVELAIQKVEGELDPGVQRAYLALMAHRPRPEALGPASRLLADESVGSAAAEVIGSLAEAGLLDESEREAARREVLALLEAGRVKPAMVGLLSRLAGEADAERLEGLLDHADASVRAAAAEAFVRGRLDPTRLLDELDDEVLRPRAIEAAARHGETVEVAKRLLQHEPKEAGARQAWRTAIVAIAGRLDVSGLARLEEAIGNAEGRALRLAVLEHALTLNGGESAREERVKLLLRLAALRLAAEQVDEVGEVYEQLGQMSLEGELADRLARRRLAWLVASRQYERVLSHAETTLANEAIPKAEVCERLLEAATAAMSERKTEQAGALLARVERIGAEGKAGLTEAARKRLATLRQKLAELQTSPPAEETGGADSGDEIDEADEAAEG